MKAVILQVNPTKTAKIKDAVELIGGVIIEETGLGPIVEFNDVSSYKIAIKFFKLVPIIDTEEITITDHSVYEFDPLHLCHKETEVS